MDIESIRTKSSEMILRFSVPSIVAMVLTSCITLADGFFIGNYIGKEGIAAVNLGLPILYVYLAIGIMVAVGGMAIAGMALGAGNLNRCNSVFNQTIVSVAAVSVLLSIIVFLLFRPITNVIGISPEVAVLFRKYYSVMIIAYPVMLVNSAMGMFIRGEGKPQVFMMISIITVVLNIILDFVFMAVMGLGTEGTALASLVSLLTGFFCMVMFFRLKSDVYKFGKFAFSASVLKNTVLNGSSEFIGQMSMSICMFAYNHVILKTAGVTGVAAFTVIGYASYLFSMIIIGFGQGCSPLISYCYGAGDSSLAKRLRKKTNLFVFIAGLSAALLMTAGSGWYSRVFVGDEGVADLIRSGLYIFVISFLFSGVNTITSFYFTSIGKAGESAVISSSRGLVLLLIFIFTLPAAFGMIGVWLVAPLTEGLTLILSLALAAGSDKKIEAAGVAQDI